MLQGQTQQSQAQQTPRRCHVGAAYNSALHTSPLRNWCNSVPVGPCKNCRCGSFKFAWRLNVPVQLRREIGKPLKFSSYH